MSLRLKIVALVIGLTGAILGGLWLLLAGSFAGWSSEAADRELVERAQAILPAVEVEEEDFVEVEEKHARRAVRDPAHPIRLLGPDGVPLLVHGEVAWPAADLAATAPRFDTVEDDGRSWRVVTLAVTPRGKHVRPGLRVAVQVAGEVGASHALEERFRSGLLVALAAALLVGGAGAAALAHVSLAPLRRLASEIDAIGATSLDRRVGTSGLDRELGRVAGAFNDLLARLEDAMRRQRELVSRASHALRTPVATVLTRAEVALRRERDPEGYREALGDVATAARECSALVAHLLTLSRLDERRGAVVAEDVPLAEVTGQLQRLLSPRAAEARVALELDAPGGLGVRADRTALRELLEALLDNAIHYTPPGGRVGLRAAGTGSGCALTVWDTGPGIPAEERGRVFDRFYRGAGALAAGRSGSGLGLAIVKAIATAHGASVTLGDHPGGGLEVTVVFPRPPA